MTSRPIDVAELAERLGRTRDWLYRPANLAALYAENMPKPLSEHGRKKWDRPSMLAWLGRHHPLARSVANDLLPQPAANDDAAWARKLSAAYGSPPSK